MTHKREALAARLGGGGQQELRLVDNAAAQGEPAVEAPVGTHVLRAPDPEDEVRAVARRIMERASRGIPLHEIAVVFRLDEPYARLVPEIFDSAGIAWNGPSPRRLSDSVLARVLLGILDLADSHADTISRVTTSPRGCRRVLSATRPTGTASHRRAGTWSRAKPASWRERGSGPNASRTTARS